MKKLMLFAVAAVALLSACDKDDEGIALSLNKTEFPVAVTGGEGEFTITTTGSWTVVADKPEMFSQLEPTAGTGNATVYFTVKPNKTLDEKTAILTVAVAGGETKKVTVTLPGRDNIDSKIKLAPVNEIAAPAWSLGWGAMLEMMWMTPEPVKYQMWLFPTKAAADAFVSGSYFGLADMPLNYNMAWDEEALQALFATTSKIVPSDATYDQGGVSYGGTAEITVVSDTKYYYVIVILAPEGGTVMFPWRSTTETESVTVMCDDGMGGLVPATQNIRKIMHGEISVPAATTAVFGITTRYTTDIYDEFTLTEE